MYTRFHPGFFIKGGGANAVIIELRGARAVVVFPGFNLHSICQRELIVHSNYSN